MVAQHAQRVQQLSAEATSNSKNDILDRLKESDARLADIKAQVGNPGPLIFERSVQPECGMCIPALNVQFHECEICIPCSHMCG